MPHLEKLVGALLAVETVISLSVMLLHPGFDKKNSLGLDFDFYIAMAAVAGLVWIAGVVFALQLDTRKGLYIFGHLVSLIFGVLYFLLV